MTDIIPYAKPNNWANLVWALGETDITASVTGISPQPDLPWLPERRRKHLLAFFSNPSITRQLRPKLENFLQNCDQQKPTTRLGIYFERLWSFVFEHHPDYQLLYHNLPLRTEGRTLGELDFLITHLPSNICEHWEVAVKFYLEVPGGFSVGPGIKDRLDIKLQRMEKHQLPLIHQPEAKHILTTRKLDIQRQWALMPGRLFKPLDANQASKPRYWWGDIPSFTCHFGKPISKPALRWLQLPKQCWLAPVQHDYNDGLTIKHLLTTLKSSRLDKPLCIAALDCHGEVTRGFIVPGDWETKAINFR